MTARGLSRIATPELERLLHMVEHGELTLPLNDATLDRNGFELEMLDALGELDRVAVVRIVTAALAERAHRIPPRLDLVWTGPEARVSTARDTAVLLRELFASATKTVLIAGYSFDHGRDILAPLHEVMRSHGVTTHLFLQIERADGDASAADYARSMADRFLGQNWPFGPPFPLIYYDPRTIAPGSVASLHAKCAVVDNTHTLITSANFTDRAQSRNIELGVLIEDKDFATRVSAQWRGLVDSGLMLEIEQRSP